MHAIRGAITVDENSPAAIESATSRMLTEVLRRNGLSAEDVISAFFSLTPDLNAAFPARAARALGWGDVPMLDTVEIDVPGALPRTIRVLLHVRSDGPAHHAYLDGAAVLRPDLAGTS